MNAHVLLLNVNQRNNNGSAQRISIVVTITTPKKGEKTVFTFLLTKPWMFMFLAQRASYLLGPFRLVSIDLTDELMSKNDTDKLVIFALRLPFVAWRM